MPVLSTATYIGALTALFEQEGLGVILGWEFLAIIPLVISLVQMHKARKKQVPSPRPPEDGPRRPTPSTFFSPFYWVIDSPMCTKFRGLASGSEPQAPLPTWDFYVGHIL